jgi:hypothetical protein
MIVRFAGVQIGDDDATGLAVETYRAGQPEVQQGLLRPEALLSDESPNLYWLMRVVVHKKSTGAIALARWMVAMGELMKKGLQQVTVTEGADTLTMDSAAMRGPFVVPERNESNPALARNVAVQFVSASRPY